MNTIAVWLSENEGVGVLGSMEVPETGLRRHDASWPPCVIALCALLVVGEGASSCCLENGGMVPPSMGNACPDVACQYTAMVPFVSANVVAGHIANTAQLDVLMALQ